MTSTGNKKEKKNSVIFVSHLSRGNQLVDHYACKVYEFREEISVWQSANLAPPTLIDHRSHRDFEESPKLTVTRGNYLIVSSISKLNKCNVRAREKRQWTIYQA